LTFNFRYAVRLLRRDPGYAAVAVLTMALGIGATTTLFSVAYGVLLKSLPWDDADRIMRVVETRDGHHAGNAGTISNGAYLSWRDRPETIDAIGGYSIGVDSVTARLDGSADPVRLRVTAMTPSAFAVLRARPLRGRLFRDDETPAAELRGMDAPGPILISHALWQDWFGGRDAALGTVVRFDDVPHTIVGVMPPAFAFPDTDTRAWTPMTVPPPVRILPNATSMMIFGGLARLRPGIASERAAAEGTTRARQVPDPGFAAVAMFGSDAPSVISMTPLALAMAADVRPALLLLLAAVALLLATAVANVGGLQLARASTRRREMAIRGALGAGQAILVGQLLSETAVVTAAGAVGGIAIALALVRSLPSLLPADFPRAADIAVNLPVLAFVILVSAAASLAASLMPATLARRVDVTSALAADGGACAVGVWHSHSGRLRLFVMIGQVAVACTLLVGAALLTRSFVALMHADRGYDPSNLLTARVELPRRSDGAAHVRIADAVVERMRAAPGVMHAGAGNAMPLVSVGTALGTELPAPDNPAVNVQVHANVRLVSPDYFAALRLPLLQGRLLTDADGTESPAIVVSRSFVRQYFAGDAIGKHVPIGFTAVRRASATASGADRTDWQIVGVVGDLRQGSVTEPDTPAVYVSYRQVPTSWIRSAIYFVVRTAGDPSSQIGALRAAVREQDPTLALDSITTMEERVATSLAKPRLYALLLGGFAVAALVIAGVGLFSVLSYSVAQRSREIGVRTALGAQVHDIVALVLRHAMIVAIVGVAIGLWAAYAATRYLSSFLYGVTGSDMLSYVVVALVVGAAAVLACVVPARRAARIDPVVALRIE
jgi:putative ABC transport system permease protein